MELISGYVLPCLYAFLACIGFCFLFNIHGIGMFICAGGAGLGWLCYLLTAPLVGSDIIQAFLAALVISAWSEIMARLAPGARSPAICWWRCSRWSRAAGSTIPWSTL